METACQVRLGAVFCCCSSFFNGIYVLEVLSVKLACLLSPEKEIIDILAVKS